MTSEVEEVSCAGRLALRPEECARALGCSRATIFKLLATGEIKGWRIGSARLISTDEIRRFIHEREEADDEGAA